MKLTYDPNQNIAYIKMCDKTGNVETISVSDKLNIDMSSDETIYGIELLNANKQLVHKNNIMNMVVVNEAINTRQELQL